MAKQVEVIWFSVAPKSTADAKKKMEQLLAQGWVIAASGGGGNQTESGCFIQRSVSMGFVVLQKDTP